MQQSSSSGVTSFVCRLLGIVKIVIDGSKISAQSFRRNVGTGSKRHDFVGGFLMILSHLFSKTSLK